MNRFLSNIVNQFREFYKDLTPARRMAMIATVVIVLTSIGVVSFMLSGKSYVPLLKNVPGDQMTLILEKLREKNIPFHIGEDGSTVLIPSEFVPATQMAIMSEVGSHKVGQIGLELFDKQDFGTTTYAQRVNYQRALQGELVRAINTLEVVKQSKVMLALPPKKTFLEEGGSPKASVVVDLVPGKMLTPEQVKGITALVASAVEGLEADAVSVVDSNGRVLSRTGRNSDVGFSSEISDLQEKTERQLQDRVESILNKVVGEGKVIARVNAVIDGRSISSVEETVDPDKAAVQGTRSETESLVGNRSNPTGVPGARANLPGAQDQGTVDFKQDVNKESKVTNYEVPKTVRNIKETPGRIEKISVAVLVDGKESEAAGTDGKSEKKWQPRSAEELQKYEALVKNAIGFNEKRGDTIKVESIQFQKEDFAESAELLTKLERRKLLSYIIKWGVIALSLGLFFFVILQPFMRWITESFHESIDDMLPKTIEELEELQSVDNTLPGMTAAIPSIGESLDPDKAESELLRERIMGLINKDTPKATSALSLWLVRER